MSRLMSKKVNKGRIKRIQNNVDARFLEYRIKWVKKHYFITCSACRHVTLKFAPFCVYCGAKIDNYIDGSNGCVDCWKCEDEQNSQKDVNHMARKRKRRLQALFSYWRYCRRKVFQMKRESIKNIPVPELKVMSVAIIKHGSMRVVWNDGGTQERGGEWLITN